MNPYVILGLDKRTATPEIIRRVYRKMAAQAHPDRGPNAVGDFHAIQRANRVLADPNAKEIYDRTGIIPGEDRRTEEAIMLIVKVSAPILLKDVTCDLPRMLRATIKQLRARAVQSEKITKRGIKQVETRWKGAEAVRESIILNFERYLGDLVLQMKVHDRAIQLLDTANYGPAEACDSGITAASISMEPPVQDPVSRTAPANDDPGESARRGTKRRDRSTERAARIGKEKKPGQK